MGRRMTLLHLHAIDDEALWRATLASHGIESVCMPRDHGIVEQLQRDVRLAGAGAMIVDAPTLAPYGLTATTLVRRLQRVNPELSVFLRLPHRARIGGQERAWAARAGLAGLLPGSSSARWRESIVPSLGPLFQRVGRGAVHAERVGEYLRVLDVRQSNAAAGAVDQAFEAAGDPVIEGLDLAAISSFLQGPGGVPVEDRTYLGKTYRQCFVASDAVRALVAKQRLGSAAALAACRAMQRLGAIHHVVREKTFDDAFLFFRFAGACGVDLVEASAAMLGAGGLDIADRTYRGKTYPQCFVGSDAVTWLVGRHGITVGEAEAVGQRLLDLGVLRHVLGEHDFSDANLFYRFVGE